MQSQKRIIICCDGTWQSSASLHGKDSPPSNVERMRQVIAKTGTDMKKQIWQQNIHYIPGVGSEDLSQAEKTRQGGLGKGVDEKICAAYKIIACNYSPGDELSFFGFSRGAFIVRSLAGLICELGILESTSIDHFRRIYKIYQKKPAGVALKDSPEWRDYLIMVEEEEGEAPQLHTETPVIRVVGVWDTVGSLGIPNLHWFDFSGFRKKYEFHDTSLHDQIKNAFHALALDETRSAFTPTLWQLPEDQNRHQSSLCQVWFPGAHIDVGGGNSDNITNPPLSSREHLANITFAWMIDMIQPYIAVHWDSVQKLLRRVERDNNKGYAAGVISSPPWWWWLQDIPKSRTPDRYHDNRRRDTCEYIHESVRLKNQQQQTQYNPAFLKNWTLEQVPKNEGQGHSWRNGHGVNQFLEEFNIGQTSRSAELYLKVEADRKKAF